jgi:hypothetical protein
MNTWVLCLALAVMGVAADTAHAQAIWYVDDDAPASVADGTSWHTAFHVLQDAFTAAKPGDELRIAQGTYRPDQGKGYTPGDKDASFVLKNGMTVRGGYGGVTEPEPDARDFELYQTILSCDLLGDDDGWNNRLDNGKSVLRALNLTENTTLEGLTIRGGYAGGPGTHLSGGGIHALGSRMTVLSCTFTLNLAIQGGGAVLWDSLDSTVDGCSFLNNRALCCGGGLMVEINDPQMVVAVEDCLFKNQNVGLHSFSSMHSGGLHLDIASDVPDPVVRNCQFIGNWTESASAGAGSASFIGGSYRGIYIDCDFLGNASFNIGGVKAKTLINCHVIGNVGIDSIGGAAVVNAINCTFSNNHSSVYPGGGGLRANGGDFVNCHFINNSAFHNALPGDGIGGAVTAHGSPRFTNCVFNHNYSGGAGGTIAVGNNSSAELINCTITQGLSDTGAGAIAGTGVVRNSIVWNNGMSPILGNWDIEYSCIEEGWLGEGNIESEPMFVDALGLDGLAGTDDDDLRLLSGSSCIDSGDNIALPLDLFDLDADDNSVELLPLDLDGNLRRVNDPKTPNTGNPSTMFAIVDMGATEFVDFAPLLGDVDGNGVVDVDDLLAVVNSWGLCDMNDCPADIAPKDGDGLVDVEDLAFLLLNWS